MQSYSSTQGPVRIHRRLAALVVVVAVLGVSSCARSDDGRSASDAAPRVQPHIGGHLAVGLETDPSGIDPIRNGWDPAALMVANAIFDPLMAYDAQGVVRPFLAESLTPDATFTAWTLRLRPGIRFQNGTPLNAAAVVRWWEALQAGLITGPAMAYYDRFERIDDLTVVAHTNRPYASLPHGLTTQGGFVSAPEQLDDPNGSINPIGTGPFKLQHWEIGKRVTVERNPGYWRRTPDGTALPYLDSIDFVVAGQGDRVRDLRSGELDVVATTSFEESQRFRDVGAGEGVTVEQDPGASDSDFVMFNTTIAPFDDLRVRQAVAHATDVAALAKANGWPPDRLAHGPFGSSSFWYADVHYPGYDPAEARRLVADYEADRGPIHFEVMVGHEENIAQQLIEQWAQVGIHATLSLVEFKKSVIVAVTGQYQATLFRYFAAQDPDVLWHFWASESIQPGNPISLNFTRLTDPVLDQALATGRQQHDPAVRKAAYATIQQRFADLGSYVWLYRTQWTIAHRTHVRDAHNRTLPDGTDALTYEAGVFRLAETWIEH